MIDPEARSVTTPCKGKAVAPSPQCLPLHVLSTVLNFRESCRRGGPRERSCFRPLSIIGDYMQNVEKITGWVSLCQIINRFRAPQKTSASHSVAETVPQDEIQQFQQQEKRARSNPSPTASSEVPLETEPAPKKRTAHKKKTVSKLKPAVTKKPKGATANKKKATSPVILGDAFDAGVEDASVDPVDPAPAAREAVSRSSGKVNTDRPSIPYKKRTVTKNKKPVVVRKPTVPRPRKQAAANQGGGTAWGTSTANGYEDDSLEHSAHLLSMLGNSVKRGVTVEAGAAGVGGGAAVDVGGAVDAGGGGVPVEYLETVAHSALSNFTTGDCAGSPVGNAGGAAIEKAVGAGPAGGGEAAINWPDFELLVGAAAVTPHAPLTKGGAMGEGMGTGGTENTNWGNFDVLVEAAAATSHAPLLMTAGAVEEGVGDEGVVAGAWEVDDDDL